MQKIFVISITLLVFAVSCKRKIDNGGNPNKLSYGDSVFYLKSNNYSITPSTAPGTYSAFPENLNINSTTGVITISEKGLDQQQSQMGLRYKIMYTSNTGQKDSTYIVLAGINYQDKIYNLSQNQNLAYPIYNGDIVKPLPPGNYAISASSGVVINPANGQLDLRAMVDNGFFNTPAENGEWEEITITYKANDGSTANSSIKMLIYFYSTIPNIASNVSTVMRAHQSLILGVPAAEIPITNAPPDLEVNGIVSVSKPRPPCIIIVAN